MHERIPTNMLEAKEMLQAVREEKTRLEKELKAKDESLTQAALYFKDLLDLNETYAEAEKYYREELKKLTKHEYGSKSESLLKILKEQPLLFSTEDLKLQLLTKLKQQIENKNKTESKKEIQDKKSAQPIDENDTTIENVDIDVDKTLPDSTSSEKESSRGRKSIYNTYGHIEEIVTREDLSEEERICSKCGGKMTVAYVRFRNKLEFIPAHVVNHRVEYYVYECTHCTDDTNENGTSLKKTANIKEMIPGGIASASLLAHIFSAKYLNHTTFHTKAQTMSWENMPICKQNMTNWQIKSAEKLKPLYNLLINELKQSKYINFDETPLDVLKIKEEDVAKEYWPGEAPPKKRNCETISECRIWVGLGESNNHLIKTFNFRYTRSGHNLMYFLDNASNLVAIQSDSYAGYDRAIKEHNKKDPSHHIDLCNCLVHARRYFVNVWSLSHNTISLEVLKKLKEVFFLDKQLRDDFYNGHITEEEFLKIRDEEERPLLESIKDFLTPYYGKGKIRTNTQLKQAVDYFMKNYDKLIKYLDYSFITPSNNKSEQMCKVAVLTRKNSLFSSSPAGAESSCILLTLLHTAIANKINPEDYLRCLFEKAPYAETTSDWEKLLPWNIEITPYKLSKAVA